MAHHPRDAARRRRATSSTESSDIRRARHAHTRTHLCVEYALSSHLLVILRYFNAVFDNKRTHTSRARAHTTRRSRTMRVDVRHMSDRRRPIVIRADDRRARTRARDTHDARTMRLKGSTPYHLDSGLVLTAHYREHWPHRIVWLRYGILPPKCFSLVLQTDGTLCF